MSLIFKQVKRPDLTIGVRATWESAVLLVELGCALACLKGTAFADSAAPSCHYYAIENVDSGIVVRRGTTMSAGVPPFRFILSPETNYGEWLYAVETALIGSVDFRSRSACQSLEIPAVRLELPRLPDSDGDGLSDDADFVIGTSPRNPDTDSNDSLSDDHECLIGSNPSKVVGASAIALRLRLGPAYTFNVRIKIIHENAAATSFDNFVQPGMTKPVTVFTG